jgi:hypothetical protein
VPRWARRTVTGALVVLALVVIVRLILDPVAAYATRRGLGSMKGLRGDFDRVHVTVFRPGYTITRLKVIQEPGGEWRAPLFFAESVHVGLDWRRLVHGDLVARARIVEPKVTIVARPGPSKGQPRAPDLSTELRRATPVDVDRVEVLRGEVLFREAGGPGHPELWIHDLELATEHLATRQKLVGERPATIAARGVLGRSGRVSLFVSADPFASPLAFAGRFELVGLRATELYGFVAPKVKLAPTKGTVNLYAEFKAKDGRVSGGVKPVLENIDVQPTESGVGDRLKAWLVGLGLEVGSDRVPGRNAVATIVPLEGRLESPDVELWPAILGVVRNAFVQGVASGFSHLPPPEAPKEQGKLTQAKEALTKSKGPPKAQPAAPREEKSK